MLYSASVTLWWTWIVSVESSLTANLYFVEILDKKAEIWIKHCKILEVLLPACVCCSKNLLSLPYFNVPVAVSGVILLKRRIQLKELQIYFIKSKSCNIIFLLGYEITSVLIGSC